MPNQGKILKTQTYLGLSFVRSILGLSLKPLAHNYQCLFIAILCAKISSLYMALGVANKLCHVTVFDLSPGHPLPALTLFSNLALVSHYINYCIGIFFLTLLRSSQVIVTMKRI